MDTILVKTAPDLQCTTCKKRFKRKSSLVRHTKICPNSNRKPRQRSCVWCAADRSKCDLQRPSCGRCASRKLLCTYKHSKQTPRPNIASGTYVPLSDITQSFDTLDFNQTLPNPGLGLGLIIPPPQPHPSDSPNEVSFASLMALFSEDNSYPQSLIVNPATWRQSVHLSPKSRSPLCQHSLEFSFRVLRTWPRMMARDLDPPPLFHLTQLVPERMATPLANCFAIVKMWQGHWGIAAGGLVHDTTVRELVRLLREYRKFTEPELVATLQALSIYMILLLFPSSSTNTNTDISIPTIHMVILANMQKLVHHATSTAPGLTLPEETTHTVPLWHSWIKTTSRRRAVFALYLIHWSLSTYYGLPALDCEELKLMLAPAAKGLWQAKDAEVWGEKYRQWLGEWAGVEYLHGEVAEIVGGVCLDRRGERWLEETDELGLLLLALGERVKLDREKL